MNAANHALLAVAACLATLQAQTFEDVTVAAGFIHSQHSILPSSELQPYMTGGACAGDYNNDGHIDLYVTILDGADILYQNTGLGSFTNATATAFGAGHLASVETNGCAWSDIDNDGDLDLYVTSLHSTRYHLFINSGAPNYTFTEEAVARGASVTGPDIKYGTSVSTGDYDRDGYLDFHVTEWRLAGQNSTASLPNNRLLHNLGAANPGHFEDLTAAAGVATDSILPPSLALYSFGFASRFVDIDQDLLPDLLLASDHLTSRLWWNLGDGTFSDGTAAAMVGTDQFGMGNAVGDYDGDGDLDWFVTSIFDAAARNGNRLYRNDGNRTFSDATDAAGVRDGGWGWAAAFFDYDHDGDLDLIMTNGVDFPFPNENTSAGFTADPTILFQNDGTGQFTDVSGPGSGIVDNASGKGLVLFDYDNDGDLDVYIANNGSTPAFYRNLTNSAADWLKVQLVGVDTNRQGIGAHASLLTTPGAKPMIRFADGGTNFLGQNDAGLHFGIGDGSAPVDALVIRWPNGRIQARSALTRNQTLSLTEPSALAGTPVIIHAANTAIDTGNAFTLTWPSTPDATYLVRSSDDLTNWSDFSVIRGPLGSDTASCTDPSAALVPRRFYLVLQVAE